MKKILLASVVAIATMFTSANANEIVGQVFTSGLFFKDSISISAIDDPDYSGITCYVTSADRSLSWDNPTDSSIACRQVGPITETSFSDRKEVFEQAQSPFFKYQQVDRFYDQKRHVLIYISYVRKMKGENHAHSISVVPIKQ